MVAAAVVPAAAPAQRGRPEDGASGAALELQGSPPHRVHIPRRRPADGDREAEARDLAGLIASRLSGNRHWINEHRP